MVRTKISVHTTYALNFSKPNIKVICHFKVASTKMKHIRTGYLSALIISIQQWVGECRSIQQNWMLMKTTYHICCVEFPFQVLFSSLSGSRRSVRRCTLPSRRMTDVWVPGVRLLAPLKTERLQNHVPKPFCTRFLTNSCGLCMKCVKQMRNGKPTTWSWRYMFWRSADDLVQYQS